MDVRTSITECEWEFFQEQGYLPLGRVLTDQALARLQGRIDEIMLGRASINYDRLMMQLDSDTGHYSDLSDQTSGHKGSTIGYRKIQGLENDPLFLEYMQQDLFRSPCHRVYGRGTDISCFRAMFMNKPAQRGTHLPWHQDRWTRLDRDPRLSVWTALDPATRANGCVEIIPASHKRGVINPEHPSSFLTPEQVAVHCPGDSIVYLELAAGEAALLDNWVLHSSDVNKTSIPRRAFSVCYMDARTKDEDFGTLPVVFGKGALSPSTVGLAQTIRINA